MQQQQTDIYMDVLSVADKCVASLCGTTSLFTVLFPPSSSDSKVPPLLTSQAHAVRVLDAVLRGLQEASPASSGGGGGSKVKFHKGAEGDWERIFDALDALPLFDAGGGAEALPVFPTFKMRFVTLGSSNDRKGVNELVAAVSRNTFGVASRWLWRGAAAVVAQNEAAMGVLETEVVDTATAAIRNGAPSTDAPIFLSRLWSKFPRKDAISKRAEVLQFIEAVACVESVAFHFARLADAEGPCLIRGSFAEFLLAVGSAVGPSAATAAATVDRAVVDAIVVAATTGAPMLCMIAASRSHRAIHALYRTTPPDAAEEDTLEPSRLSRLLRTATAENGTNKKTDKAASGLAAFALLLHKLVKVSADFLENWQIDSADAERTFIDTIIRDGFGFSLSTRVEAFWEREGPSGSLRAFSALLTDRTLFDPPPHDDGSAASGGAPAPRETVVGDHFAAHFASTKELWDDVLSSNSADACLALRIRPPPGLSAAAASSWCIAPVLFWSGGETEGSCTMARPLTTPTRVGYYPGGLCPDAPHTYHHCLEGAALFRHVKRAEAAGVFPCAERWAMLMSLLPSVKRAYELGLSDDIGVVVRSADGHAVSREKTTLFPTVAGDTKRKVVPADFLFVFKLHGDPAPAEAVDKAQKEIDARCDEEAKRRERWQLLLPSANARLWGKGREAELYAKAVGFDSLDRLRAYESTPGRQKTLSLYRYTTSSRDDVRNDGVWSFAELFNNVVDRKLTPLHTLWCTTATTIGAVDHFLGRVQHFPVSHKAQRYCVIGVGALPADVLSHLLSELLTEKQCKAQVDLLLNTDTVAESFDGEGIEADDGRRVRKAEVERWAEANGVNLRRPPDQQAETPSAKKKDESADQPKEESSPLLRFRYELPWTSEDSAAAIPHRGDAFDEAEVHAFLSHCSQLTHTRDLPLRMHINEDMLRPTPGDPYRPEATVRLAWMLTRHGVLIGHGSDSASQIALCLPKRLKITPFLVSPPPPTALHWRMAGFTPKAGSKPEARFPRIASWKPNFASKDVPAYMINDRFGPVPQRSLAPLLAYLEQAHATLQRASTGPNPPDFLPAAKKVQEKVDSLLEEDADIRVWSLVDELEVAMEEVLKKAGSGELCAATTEAIASAVAASPSFVGTKEAKRRLRRLWDCLSPTAEDHRRLVGHRMPGGDATVDEADRRGPPPLILEGGTGLGKTRSIELIARSTGKVFIKMVLHPAVTAEEIVAAVEEAMAHKDKEAIVFFDEANTTEEAAGLVKMVLLDRLLPPKKGGGDQGEQPPALRRIPARVRFVGAINPSDTGDYRTRRLDPALAAFCAPFGALGPDCALQFAKRMIGYALQECDNDVGNDTDVGSAAGNDAGNDTGLLLDEVVGCVAELQGRVKEVAAGSLRQPQQVAAVLAGVAAVARRVGVWNTSAAHDSRRCIGPREAAVFSLYCVFAAQYDKRLGAQELLAGGPIPWPRWGSGNAPRSDADVEALVRDVCCRLVTPETVPVAPDVLLTDALRLNMLLALIAALSPPERRLSVSFVGDPGVGKTLAVRAVLDGLRGEDSPLQLWRDTAVAPLLIQGTSSTSAAHMRAACDAVAKKACDAAANKEGRKQEQQHLSVVVFDEASLPLGESRVHKALRDPIDRRVAPFILLGNKPLADAANRDRFLLVRSVPLAKEDALASYVHFLLYGAQAATAAPNPLAIKVAQRFLEAGSAAKPKVYLRDLVDYGRRVRAKRTHTQAEEDCGASVNFGRRIAEGALWTEGHCNDNDNALSLVYRRRRYRLLIDESDTFWNVDRVVPPCKHTVITVSMTALEQMTALRDAMAEGKTVVIRSDRVLHGELFDVLNLRHRARLVERGGERRRFEVRRLAVVPHAFGVDSFVVHPQFEVIFALSGAAFAALEERSPAFVSRFDRRIVRRESKAYDATLDRLLLVSPSLMPLLPDGRRTFSPDALRIIADALRPSVLPVLCPIAQHTTPSDTKLSFVVCDPTLDTFLDVPALVEGTPHTFLVLVHGPITASRLAHLAGKADTLSVLTPYLRDVEEVIRRDFALSTTRPLVIAVEPVGVASDAIFMWELQHLIAECRKRVALGARRPVYIVAPASVVPVVLRGETTIRVAATCDYVGSVICGKAGAVEDIIADACLQKYLHDSCTRDHPSEEAQHRRLRPRLLRSTVRSDECLAGIRRVYHKDRLPCVFDDLREQIRQFTWGKEEEETKSLAEAIAAVEGNLASVLRSTRFLRLLHFSSLPETCEVVDEEAFGPSFEQWNKTLTAFTLKDASAPIPLSGRDYGLHPLFPWVFVALRLEQASVPLGMDSFGPAERAMLVVDLLRCAEKAAPPKPLSLSQAAGDAESLMEGYLAGSAPLAELAAAEALVSLWLDEDTSLGLTKQRATSLLHFAASVFTRKVTVASHGLRAVVMRRLFTRLARQAFGVDTADDNLKRGGSDVEAAKLLGRLCNDVGGASVLSRVKSQAIAALIVGGREARRALALCPEAPSPTAHAAECATAAAVTNALRDAAPSRAEGAVCVAEVKALFYCNEAIDDESSGGHARHGCCCQREDASGIVATLFAAAHEVDDCNDVDPVTRGGLLDRLAAALLAVLATIGTPMAVVVDADVANAISRAGIGSIVEAALLPHRYPRDGERVAVRWLGALLAGHLATVDESHVSMGNSVDAIVAEARRVLRMCRGEGGESKEVAHLVREALAEAYRHSNSLLEATGHYWHSQRRQSAYALLAAAPDGAKAELDRLFGPTALMPKDALPDEYTLYRKEYVPFLLGNTEVVGSEGTSKDLIALRDHPSACAVVLFILSELKEPADEEGQGDFWHTLFHAPKTFKNGRSMVIGDYYHREMASKTNFIHGFDCGRSKAGSIEEKALLFLILCTIAASLLHCPDWRDERRDVVISSTCVGGAGGCMYAAVVGLICLHASEVEGIGAVPVSKWLDAFLALRRLDTPPTFDHHDTRNKADRAACVAIAPFVATASADSLVANKNGGVSLQQMLNAVGMAAIGQDVCLAAACSSASPLTALLGDLPATVAANAVAEAKAREGEARQHECSEVRSVEIALGSSVHAALTNLAPSLTAQHGSVVFAEGGVRSDPLLSEALLAFLGAALQQPYPCAKGVTTKARRLFELRSSIASHAVLGSVGTSAQLLQAALSAVPVKRLVFTPPDVVEGIEAPIDTAG